MNTRWFYQQAGHDFGPYTGAEIYWLAALGLVRPESPVWAEGQTRQAAVAAARVIDFGELRRPHLEAPPWVGAAPDRAPPGPRATAPPRPCVPSWLGDIRQMEELLGREADAANCTNAGDDAGARPSPGGNTQSRSGGEAIPELLQRAMAAIDVWVTLEVKRNLVLADDTEALRRDAAVQLILRQVEPGGADLVIRCWEYLGAEVRKRRADLQAHGVERHHSPDRAGGSPDGR